MTIARVKPANWGIGEKLTSAQQNQLDTNVTYALDKRSGQTDTLESIVTETGAGRITTASIIGADANTTYAIGDARHIRVTSSLTANREYTLSTTGAQTGDKITVVFESGSFRATIKDAVTSAVLAVVGPEDGTSDANSATFYFRSQWRLEQHPRGRMFASTFAANGTWTCPRGVSEVVVIGCGGGGGGGAGSAGGAPNVQSSGGAGGGGALRGVHHVAVVAGTGYTVVVGAGGTAGAVSGGDGGDGADSTFGGTITFPGGQGGLGGVTQSGTPTTSYRLSPGGHPVRGGIRHDKIAPTSTTIITPSMPSGSGGYGRTKATTPNMISAGSMSQSGFAGGAAGSAGSDTGANIYGGGPGAGGGGGAFGAGGAGGGGAISIASDPGFAGASGTAGAANTGAGGGGGGGGGSTDGTFAGGAGGAGAAGGSGKVIVLYVK